MRNLYFLILIIIAGLGTANVFLKNRFVGSMATVLQASPQAFVFAQVKGIEHFASKTSIEFFYLEGDSAVVEITPKLYEKVQGWLSFRRAYLGIPLFYTSDFLFTGQTVIGTEVLTYAYCNGPLLEEMKLRKNVKNFNLIIQSQTSNDGREWRFEYRCQN